MEHKSWPWKRKSIDKTAIASDKANTSLRRNEAEIQALLTDKVDMERELKILNDKLSSALSDCNSKDELAKKQSQIAQEAIAGWEKTETEAISLKQQLDRALQQKAAGEERLIHIDAALKECMKQLRFVREEQEKRIHDAVVKASKEFGSTRIMLEEKLADASARLSRLSAENAQLSKALLAKEKVIEDIKEQRTQMETDLSALMARLESTEKQNTSLIYEVRVLEKELEIRNEEREFTRRTADVTHKQNLESAKKIAKLESECQRLRLLVRKRLPGPAALAKMKNEVESLGRDPVEIRRRKSNPSSFGSMDFLVDMAPDTPSRRIRFLNQQLCVMEEENRSLKEALKKKVNDLQPSRIMSAHTARKSSQVEAHLEESLKGHIIADLGSHIHNESFQEVSMTSMSDMGSEDKASCAESWASALISELEHFKNGKQMATPSRKSFGVSDIDLMDDFLEMEKLAVGSKNNPSASPCHASQEGAASCGTSGTKSGRNSSEAAGREMVSTSNQEINSVTTKINHHSGWLDDVLKVLLEQCYITQKSADEILEDIRAALALKHHSYSKTFKDMESSTHLDTHCTPESGEHISQGSADESLRRDASDRGFLAMKKSSQRLQSNVTIPLNKMIELVEGITIPSLDDGNSEILFGKGHGLANNSSETPTGYMIRLFQWKTSELSAILKQFVETCHELLHGKADFEKFAEQITCTLEWILNHCFSLQDVSSMKDEIKNHFDWDDTRSESEMEGGIINQISNSDRLHAQRAELASFTSVSSGDNCSLQMEEFLPIVKEEDARLKEEFSTMASAKKDLEGRLQSEISRSESLMIQVQESENLIKNLQAELETLKKSKRMIEEQIEKHKIVNEDLETQLTVAKFELDKACEKLLYLEKELENKCNSREKLEATCHDLQLQLSMAKKEVSEDEVDDKERVLQNDWEITAASEKLAECQETIFNLGRQLKALASPRDAALFDKLNTNPFDDITTEMESPMKNSSQRSSLLDKMLAEDIAEVGDLNSPKTKETILNGDGATESPQRSVIQNGIRYSEDKTSVGSMVIVPVKKKNSGGLLKKLIWRPRKGSSKNKLVS